MCAFVQMYSNNEMEHSMKKVSILLPLLMILSLLQGCHGSSGTAASSSVRLVNGDLSALNMYYWPGGSTTTPAASGIPYAVASSGVSIGSGDITIAVANAVSSAPSNGTAFSFTGGYGYTMVAYPSYKSGQKTLQVAQLIDNQVIPPSGSGLFGIADYSSADKLDVYVVSGNNASLAGASPWTLQGGISGNTAYAQEPTGTTSAPFHIQVTGAGAGPNNDVRLDIPSITIGNQQVMTLALLPTQGGVLLDGLLILQQGINPMAGQPYATGYKNGSVRVRVAASGGSINTIAASGVTINSAPIANSGDINAVSAYIPVSLTSYGGAATPQSGVPATTPISLSVTINSTVNCTASVMPGQDLTVLFMNNACNPITDDNTLAVPLSSGTAAKLRLVNAVNGTAPSYGYSYAGSFNTAGVASGVASTPLNVPADGATNYNLSVTPSTGTSTSWGTTTVLEPQGVYSIFVLGDTTAASAVLVTDHPISK
jgi:hypothetical protein